uniref:BPTI/Kunitz inhibitor domain-containing protein n=1 Tax=Ditylenchus dipsaci TaxID=166011 RepID=A0A915CUC6_9BILA
MTCQTQNDCVAGNLCTPNGTCGCMSSHVEVDKYCWRKIAPGEPGCILDRQCETVWPGAYCQRGTCQCADNQRLFKTRDGPVCLDKQGYDAIPVSRTERWYYDSNTGQCLALEYKGYGGNANNFLTKEHCQSYCSLICSRGLPLYRNGRAGSRKQEPLVCNEGGYSDVNYQCEQPVSTFFKSAKPLQYYCPTAEFICSSNGGIPTKLYKKSSVKGLPADPFDVGVPDKGKEIQHRFYYDEKLKKCVQFRILVKEGISIILLVFTNANTFA